LLGIELPQRRRQIPQDVLLERGALGALQFGFEIATGVRTHLPTAAAHVVALFLLFGGPTLLEAVAVGVGFGLGRALQLIVTALIRDRDSFLEGWHRPVATVSRLAPIPPAAIVLAVISGAARAV